MQPTRGYISKTSPRYEDWLRVFGGDVVELENSVGVWATLPGRAGRVHVYKLKVSALEPAQRERLIVFLAAKFRQLPEEVAADLDGAHGCPILAEDVMVSVDARRVL